MAAEGAVSAPPHPSAASAFRGLQAQLSERAKAVLNDISIPADQRKPAAEALSALIRKGLVADVMIRDAITSTKQIDLTNRAGSTPIVPVGGRLH